MKKEITYSLTTKLDTATIKKRISENCGLFKRYYHLKERNNSFTFRKNDGSSYHRITLNLSTIGEDSQVDMTIKLHDYRINHITMLVSGTLFFGIIFMFVIRSYYVFIFWLISCIFPAYLLLTREKRTAKWISNELGFIQKILVLF